MKANQLPEVIILSLSLSFPLTWLIPTLYKKRCSFNIDLMTNMVVFLFVKKNI